MSGHSKWASIKRKKGATDAKRGQLFSKLTRAIIVAARDGGPDPGGNLALQNAIEKARENAMPKDNIERAIAKGTGEGGDAAAIESVLYEGYGPGGVAVIVEALTDNRNRTASNVRAAFTKAGGSLGETGSVAFMFDRVGEIVYRPEAGDADRVMEAAIEAGAEDVNSDENGHIIICAFEDIGEVTSALEASLGEAESVNTVWRPQTGTPVDEEKAQSVLRLLSVLEEDDDVQNVYANFEVDDETMARLSAA